MNYIKSLKELILYQSKNNENISVEVLYDEEDFWLTQKSMSKLFNVEENNITYHLQNIFKSGELQENRTTQEIRVVQNEGSRKVSRKLKFYSLDAIIAVGYRVNSKEATDFRIWATNTLLCKSSCRCNKRIRRETIFNRCKYFICRKKKKCIRPY